MHRITIWYFWYSAIKYFANPSLHNLYVIKHSVHMIKSEIYLTLGVQSQQLKLGPKSRTIFLILGCLVIGDISTTLMAQIAMGEKFGEVGLVANFLMKTFGTNWPFYMFLSEFALFGMTTFFFMKNTVEMFGWKMPISYLPVMTVLTLVGNNTGYILVFSL